MTFEMITDYSEPSNREGHLSVNTDIFFGQLDEIETKVQRLIDACKSLQADNSELQQKIKHLEEDLHAKDEALKRQAEEKASVRSRIDQLLAKLEDVTGS